MPIDIQRSLSISILSISTNSQWVGEALPKARQKMTRAVLRNDQALHVASKNGVDDGHVGFEVEALDLSDFVDVLRGRDSNSPMAAASLPFSP